MLTFPNAKINLGLNITEKRPDGYHNLETIFYPVPIEDALEINILNEGNGKFRLHPAHRVGILFAGNRDFFRTRAGVGAFLGVGQGHAVIQRRVLFAQRGFAGVLLGVADAGRRIVGESLAAGSIEPAHCVEQADQPFLYGILKVKPRGGAGRRAAADGRHHAGNQRSKRIFVPLLCAHRQVLLDRGLGQRHGLFLREDANNLIIAGNCAFVNVFFVGSAGKRKGFPP